MLTCPSCGTENPEGFQFCGFCTAPLTEQPTSSVQEERKVVTVLFCDLVGFTAASQAADPEDVRARIRPYHARLRQEIERCGGTVEKFGDPYERAHSLLGQTRCLIALERPTEAVRPLIEAHDLFAQLGAVPALGEAQALLDETEAAAV